MMRSSKFSPEVRLGRRGVIRGKTVRTTMSDPNAPCPLDHVKRKFNADRPNALWVSDFTYVSTADSIGRRNIFSKEVFDGTTQGMDGRADRKSANALTRPSAS